MQQLYFETTKLINSNYEQMKLRHSRPWESVSHLDAENRHKFCLLNRAMRKAMLQ